MRLGCGQSRAVLVGAAVAAAHAMPAGAGDAWEYRATGGEVRVVNRARTGALARAQPNCRASLLSAMSYLSWPAVCRLSRRRAGSRLLGRRAPRAFGPWSAGRGVRPMGRLVIRHMSELWPSDQRSPPARRGSPAPGDHAGGQSRHPRRREPWRWPWNQHTVLEGLRS